MALTVVLDTNVVLYHLGGRLVDDLPNDTLCISVISEIELLSYSGLSIEERKRIEAFVKKVNVVDLTEPIKRAAITLRMDRKLKLPDAIVAATAISLKATLMTNDAKLSKAAGLKAIVPKLT